MTASLSLDVGLLRPGLRLAVGLSGGADSVALTRALAARAGELGLVLHAAHLHHGLRGAEADGDREFCAELAGSLGLVFHSEQVDTAGEAKAHRESIEEAARRLRYGWFRRLMAAGEVDAVATAHSLDDQAETVLGKFLRGAWTEGLSGIHPTVAYPEGRILRPMLAVSREEVEAYLGEIGQTWREDASNADPAFTRNRLRHALLPELQLWNPRIREHLANMAGLARDEEDFWQAEISRIAGQLILKGRPVRGGGRADSHSETLALDVVRLAALPAAVQRRLLRYTALAQGVSLDFAATESLLRLAVGGRSGQKLSLPGPLLAERTPRELRISTYVAEGVQAAVSGPVQLPIPGEATAFGHHFLALSDSEKTPAVIRTAKAGDRVRLRHSSGPRKIKEVLERLNISGPDRAGWPVVEWDGTIVWMQAAQLEPTAGWTLAVVALDATGPLPAI